MTNRSKFILLASILLALAVIAGVVLSSMNIFDGVSREFNTGSLIIFIIIISAAVISVPVVYYSRIKKDRYEEKLTKKYYNEYEIIRDAVMNSQLPLPIKKEIKDDMLDILLSAKRNSTVFFLPLAFGIGFVLLSEVLRKFFYNY